ncbi:MAG: prepilin-type N-terminal cleavage/methylation domain-containing protein [Alphaproteobacteria bacterium]|nr:prepilin-type N-terminal cleavage/methylation domain-containing protein [Alphaproteobacteria bacterium]
MRTQVFMPKNAAERGFTLVELAIVIIIMSFLMAAFFAGLRIYWTERQDFIERSRGEQIVAGLKKFVRSPPVCDVQAGEDPGNAVCDDPGTTDIENTNVDPWRYPCPASLTLPVGDADFATEICPAFNAQRQVTSAVIGGAGGYGELDVDGNGVGDGVWLIRGTDARPSVLIGAVPTATLGISNEAMMDIYGQNRVFYAVSTDFISSPDALADENILNPTIGVLNQGDTLNSDPRARVAYVVYSAGADGAGAFNYTAGFRNVDCRQAAAGDDMGDATNCAWQLLLDDAATGPRALFVKRTMGDVRSMDAGNTNYYDDRFIADSVSTVFDDDSDRWWRSVDNVAQDDTSIINVNLRTVQVADAPFNVVNEDQEKLLVGGGVRIDNGGPWAGDQTLVQVGTPTNPGSLFLSQNNAGISGNLRFDDGNFRYEGAGFGSAIFFNNTSLDNNAATLPSGDINVFMAPTGAAGAVAPVTSVLRITNPTPTAANPTPHMGDVEIGENPETDTLDTNNFTNPTHLGSSLVFLGAQDPAPLDVCGNPRDYRGDNSDPIFMQRFNIEHDRSQLRISFGDYNPQWEFPTGGADGNNPTGKWVKDCGSYTQPLNFMDSIEIGGLVGGTGKKDKDGNALDGQFRSAFAVNGLGNAIVAGDMRIGNSNTQCKPEHFGAMRFNQNPDGKQLNGKASDNPSYDDDPSDDRMEYCGPVSNGYRVYAKKLGLTDANIPQGTWRALGTGVLNYEMTYMPCFTDNSSNPYFTYATNAYGNTCASLMFDFMDIYIGNVDSKIAPESKPSELGSNARVYSYIGSYRNPAGSLYTGNWWANTNNPIATSYVAKNDAMMVVKASIPIDLAQTRAFRVDNYSVTDGDNKINDLGNVANSDNEGYQQPIIGDGSYNVGKYSSSEIIALEGIQLMPPRALDYYTADTAAGKKQLKQPPDYKQNTNYVSEQRSTWESAIQAAIYYRDRDCIVERNSGPYICKDVNEPLKLVAMGDLINPTILQRNGGQGGTGVVTGSFPVKAGARYDIEIYIFTIWPQLWLPDHDTGTAGTLKYQDHNADGVVELMEISPDNFGF